MSTDKPTPSESDEATEPIEIKLLGNDDVIISHVYLDRVHPDLLESLRLRQLLYETGACECGAEVPMEDAILIWSGRIAYRGADRPMSQYLAPHSHDPGCPGHFVNLLQLLRTNNCKTYVINYLFPDRIFPLWPDLHQR